MWIISELYGRPMKDVLALADMSGTKGVEAKSHEK